MTILEEESKDLEQKYKSLLDNLTDGIIEFELDGTITYFNSQIYNMLGYLPEDELGNKIFDYLHPDDLMESRKILNDAVRNKTEVSLERRVRHKEGHYIPTSVRGRIVEINGKSQTTIILSDISKRKEVEQKIFEERNKADMYLNLVGVILVALDRDGNITLLNKKGNKLLKYEEGELLGKNWFRTCITKQDSKKVFSVFKKLMQGEIEQSEFYENIVLTKDGEERIISWHNALLFDEDGRITGTLSSGEDITVRKKAEQDLKISEKKYRHLFEDSPLMVALANIKGTIIDLNKRLADFVGYRKEEFIGKNLRNFTEIYPEFHVERAQALVKKLIMKRFSQPFESYFVKKSGERVWIRGQAFFIDIGTEKVIQVLMEDITERKEADQKLKESEEKFRAIAKRETFYKNLFTHDINNILNNIKSSISLFTLYQRDPKAQQEVEEVINILKEQVVRGAHLVSNVRELSKLEEPSISLRIFDARQVLDDVIQIVKENFQSRNVDIKTISFKENIPVKGNDLLFNVFENVLNNAVKYNDNQLIEIIVQISEKCENGVNYAKFEIIDNGIGIHDSMKDSIFQEGYKEEKGAKGLGFGLSLVKKILANFEGKIWVEDKIKGDYKKGSNFVILIPKK